jgi:hypothetical protein
MTGEYPGVRFDRHAEFRRAEKVVREWREKSDWSKDIPECYLIIDSHKMEANHLNLIEDSR